MKATIGEVPPTNADAEWMFELKWDGMRVIACVDGRSAQLWSGNNIDVTVRFPELVGIGSALAGTSAVLDGEVVAFNEAGRVDFSTLQPRMHTTTAADALRKALHTPVLYVVFDLLHFDGNDLTSLPLEQRLVVLDDLLEESGSWHRSSRHDDGDALLQVVRDQQMEGIMAKRRDSAYMPGRRSKAWRKIKVRQRGELVVGGWLPGAGKRAGQIGSLLVGYHSSDASGALRFAGRVGSGLDDAELDALGALLAPLAMQHDPFSPSLRRAEAPDARFVRPEVVVEVAFAEWTPDGRMRHPSYLGRRFDKAAGDVTRP